MRANRDHSGEAAQRRKEDGLARVQTSPEARSFLARARAKATELAKGREDRRVTSDDLRDHINLTGGLHRNLWGAVFIHDKNFALVGFTRSTRAISHGHVIGIWELRHPA